MTGTSAPKTLPSPAAPPPLPARPGTAARLEAVPSSPSQPSQMPAPAKPAAPTSPATPAPAAAPAKPIPPAPEAPKAAPPGILPTARKAKVETRHQMILLSFLLAVLLPPILAAAYLWGVATDQYHSRVGFSVRLEESNNTMSLLSGLTGMSTSSSSDTDILFEFIQSQNLVAEMDAELDLRSLWSKPEGDPVFTLDPEASVEDLVDYWNEMVHLTRGKNPGLLEVEVRAFEPEDATLIARTLFKKSSELINELSAIAREDAISYARVDLETAVERVKTARAEVTRFRNVNQLVNPELDIQSQAGLLSNLSSQQAATMIEIALLRDTARDNDPRLIQAERKLQVIESHIAAERRKLGFGSGEESNEAWANLVGEYENLVVDREFAEKAYTAARASYDSAVAEARRQSRYLAAYMEPTTAETSIYPQRFHILVTLSLFLLLGWSIALLIYYSVRDRR